MADLALLFAAGAPIALLFIVVIQAAVGTRGRRRRMTRGSR